MIKAYIFDLDGTLMDTEILWVDVTWRFVQQYAPDFTREESLSIVYGRSWHDVYQCIRDRVPGLAISIEAMEALMRVEFAQRRDTEDVQIRSSIALLRALAKDYPVCIVSGSPRQDLDSAIALMKIGKLLAFSLSSQDYSPGKPNPACFLMAARRMNVAPENCVVFEDSHAGVLAAKDAGMFCVALRRPGAPVQDISSADRILEDLALYTPE